MKTERKNPKKKGRRIGRKREGFPKTNYFCLHTKKKQKPDSNHIYGRAQGESHGYRDRTRKCEENVQRREQSIGHATSSKNRREGMRWEGWGGDDAVCERDDDNCASSFLAQQETVSQRLTSIVAVIRNRNRHPEVTNTVPGS